MPSMTNDPYRPIGDYAIIGNTFTAALVAPDGSIDWCCLPHFDSGAVFCRLLDARKGGSFGLGPVGPFNWRRRYLDGTAVLATEFEAASGRVRLTDCMPSPSLVLATDQDQTAACRTVLRRLEGLEGTVEIELRLHPTIDFARERAFVEPTDDGWRLDTLRESLHLIVRPPLPLRQEGDQVIGRFEVRAGQVFWIVLTHAERGGEAVVAADPAALLDQTMRHWRDWESACDYRGPYEAEVRTSARVLKLLTFAPTGGIVAAATTSLPELIGGSRNWDYRFCWLRDSALVLHSLLSIGHATAADHFFSWLVRTWQGSSRLQILYRLGGGERTPEATLDHLEGYRGSRPVRVGNAAADQVQLDVYGHLLDSASVYLRGRDGQTAPGLQRALAFLADEAARRWREPDQGLWEVRGPPAHHLSSRLLCWVALDRALGLAAAGRLDGDLERWRTEREAIRREIDERGYNARVGAFTQCLGGEGLDASALLLPILGFLPAGDRRMVSTVERIREGLGRDGLIQRYRTDDGLPGREGSFSICSLWMADNLALQGRTDEAGAQLERVLSFANDVGLMSEEIDPANGQLLGNYPQGYTHLALIRSALTLSRAHQRRADSRH
jgi:GH15 family glucan-1,4-alpha-glucosidase